ncbi:hypothetical protein VTJ04DRAFT_1388 [Mycothermus thermophilus]|uniref:uncharacterized protein n=1 Tax=Humicola insolens TaxID=85995 RepID=UPI0037439FA8
MTSSFILSHTFVAVHTVPLWAPWTSWYPSFPGSPHFQPAWVPSPPSLVPQEWLPSAPALRSRPVLTRRLELGPPLALATGPKRRPSRRAAGRVVVVM